MNANPAAESADAGTTVPYVERRAAPRFRIAQRCLVRPAAAPGDVSWKAIAYDLSAAGVGVALPYPLAAGTELWIEPWELPCARPLRARVVRSVPLAYLWLCGCELAARLSDRELQVWVPQAGEAPGHRGNGLAPACR